MHAGRLGLLLGPEAVALRGSLGARAFAGHGKAVGDTAGRLHQTRGGQVGGGDRSKPGCGQTSLSSWPLRCTHSAPALGLMHSQSMPSGAATVPLLSTEMRKPRACRAAIDQGVQQLFGLRAVALAHKGQPQSHGRAGSVRRCLQQTAEVIGGDGVLLKAYGDLRALEARGLLHLPGVVAVLGRLIQRERVGFECGTQLAHGHHGLGLLIVQSLSLEALGLRCIKGIQGFGELPLLGKNGPHVEQCIAAQVPQGIGCGEILYGLVQHAFVCVRGTQVEKGAATAHGIGRGFLVDRSSC